MSQHYTFGDNERAARRLRSLAAAYEPTSASLLRRFAGACPHRAADLGAGLGQRAALSRFRLHIAPILGEDESGHAQPKPTHIDQDDLIKVAALAHAPEEIVCDER
jgi:hypothetical protein